MEGYSFRNYSYYRGEPMTEDRLFNMVLDRLEGQNMTVMEQRKALTEWATKWREMAGRLSGYKELYRGRSTEALAALEAFQQDVDLIARGRFPSEMEVTDLCAVPTTES